MSTTSTEGNGASGNLADVGRMPTALATEDTGPLHRALAATDSDTAASAGAIAEALMGLAGGGDGGANLKRLKRHNLGTILAALLAAAGVAVTSYYATKSRSKSNEADVQDLKPRVEKTESDVRFIKARVGEVKDTVDRAMAQQTMIAEGIEQLKEEAQTDKQQRLEDEIDALKRKNRRLERGR